MSLMSVIWLLVNYGFSQVGTRDIAGTTDHGVLALQLGRHLRARGLLLAVGVAVGGIATWASPVLHAEPIYGILATVIGVLSGLNLGWYFQGTRQYTTSIALEAAGFALTVVAGAADGENCRRRALCAVVAGDRQRDHAHGGLHDRVEAAGRQATRHRRPEALGRVQAHTRFGRPLFLLSVAPMITMSATSYLLSLVASSRDVGHFGSAERLTTAILGLFGPATQVMLSTMSARVNSGHDEIGNYALMRKAMFGLTGFGLLAALVTIVAAPYIVPLIFGKDFEESVPIVQLLAIGFPFAALVQAAATFVADADAQGARGGGRDDHRGSDSDRGADAAGQRAWQHRRRNRALRLRHSQCRVARRRDCGASA